MSARQLIQPTVRYGILIAVGFVMIYPLLWMIGGALCIVRPP